MSFNMAKTNSFINYDKEGLCGGEKFLQGLNPILAPSLNLGRFGPLSNPSWMRYGVGLYKSHLFLQHYLSYMEMSRSVLHALPCSLARSHYQRTVWMYVPPSCNNTWRTSRRSVTTITAAAQSKPSRSRDKQSDISGRRQENSGPWQPASFAAYVVSAFLLFRYCMLQIYIEIVLSP